MLESHLGQHIPLSLLGHYVEELKQVHAKQNHVAMYNDLVMELFDSHSICAAL